MFNPRALMLFTLMVNACEPIRREAAGRPGFLASNFSSTPANGHNLASNGRLKFKRSFRSG